MSSETLHSRIDNLFMNNTLLTRETTINYLFLLERYAEQYGMIDVADHAQIARINLSRRTMED